MYVWRLEMSIGCLQPISLLLSHTRTLNTYSNNSYASIIILNSVYCLGFPCLNVDKMQKVPQGKYPAFVTVFFVLFSL